MLLKVAFVSAAGIEQHIADTQMDELYCRHMKKPLIIQGGMGIGVSDWKLARAVSLEGELGVVSGTGIATVFLRRLQRGDEGGHMRRAMEHFPCQGTAQKVLAAYFVEGGIAASTTFKRHSVPSVRLTPSFQRLSVVASFAEVWLAKEGHDGMVGINYLEKLQTSNLPVIYGAMLAGVDVVLMGAGIPREIPGVLDLFTEHHPASIKLNLGDADASKAVALTFDPKKVLPNTVLPTLSRPLFFPIVSSSVLAAHLMTKSTGRVDGFVVEGVLAGGHNAPPRGPMKLNERGEPIYGRKDQADLEAIKALDLPFWLAGSFGSPSRLAEALALGASGIQVGTAFAFCNESGIQASLKSKVIRRWTTDQPPSIELVFTDPQASPTGFPFKVVPLPGTLSETCVYASRPRKCDLGYLRQATVKADGSIAYFCASEPEEDYIKKGGKLENTINRKCLCNALLANIGLGQIQEDGYVEVALLTAGDDLVHIGQFLQPGADSYSAHDVLAYLLGQDGGYSQ